MKNQLFLLATSALLLTSCTKDDVIEVSQLTIGHWSESYDNPNFVMDSKVDYAFKTDGTYTIECRHALVDTSLSTTRQRIDTRHRIAPSRATQLQHRTHE